MREDAHHPAVSADEGQSLQIGQAAGIGDQHVSDRIPVGRAGPVKGAEMKSRGAEHGVDRRSGFPRVLLQHLGEPFRCRRGRRQGGDPVLAELEQEHDAEKAEHRQSEDTGGPAFPGGGARASQIVARSHGGRISSSFRNRFQFEWKDRSTR